MIVPEDDDPIKEPDPQISGESSTKNLVKELDTDPAADQADHEEDEMQNLRELTRQLEIQNQPLRPKNQANVPNEEKQINLDKDSQNVGPSRGENRSISGKIEKQSQVGEISLEIKESKDLKGDVDMQVQVSKCIALVDSGSSTVRIDRSTVPKVTTSKMAGQISTVESGSVCPDTSLFGPVLDGVEVLELGNLAEGDDSNWLCDFPKSGPPGKQKTESLLKWCRQFLDHPSPETKASCSALMSELDQASRWKTLCESTLAPKRVYSSFIEPHFGSNIQNASMALECAHKPLFSWGTSGHSGISPSQSTFKENIDWTADESISKEYKFQYLTDAQVAQLQEESFLQENAYAAASAPFKIPSASFQSQIGGAYGNQELYDSEEDEDYYDYPQAFSGRSRNTSSLPSFPPYQSPSISSDYSQVIPPRMITPKRSVSGSRRAYRKWPDSGDELYGCMPSEVRSSLRSLSSAKTNCNLDWDVQAPKSQLSRTQESVGLAPSKIQFSSGIGKPLLNVRKPMKAESSAVSNLRQPRKTEYFNLVAVDEKAGASFSPGSLRRHLSSTSIASVANVSKGSSVKEKTPATKTSSLENK
ncbi:SLAIN motif-containing protein-like isoform X1 [Phascolarctos cinereus]|uniref:SLAIN motif-containing protein-like isoform X1 n=1 Tax=Phascolarctos cinereus TaxID=38626 RepID=A0A6P5JA57_PHACI|nr:SLAIN motif-containing protein-like isoform X1 [Phascolarctos cinereus]XP_020831213.1 SLAIN motif-containing protein-like isoform X1 [Phascolarctos cinereus]XP_020831214.1 SLAIN motif-containing protein-like isoform X1 [Phascolarctos cinereus]XP_020831215.1 SLAIN motif-containing protein-like isoform X1 [Phascolarctos cinereus]XP_020831216.1 SLAIN motif-containing protein-like isoform X1 [Phascolarctos cinereus]XP_020831217.1 SLAIN motif-containing protein-like isoform X1 [Phascolarctos cin